MPQHLDALKHANDVRLARAELKRKLNAGEVDIRDVLSDPPDYLKNMKIYELILSLNRYGRERTLRLLRRAQIAESKTIAFVTPRQRNLLIEDFSRR